MYRIPKDLDLAPAVGQFTTQIRVGQFDLQFTLGGVTFVVESEIDVFKGDVLVAHWEAGKWPDTGFYDIMNTSVLSWDILDDRNVAINFDNGLQMRIRNSSDQYETMRISFDGDPRLWII